MEILGAVQQVEAQEKALWLRGDAFAVRLQVVNGGALRVQMRMRTQTADADFKDFSYSVQHREVMPFPEFNESDTHLEVPLPGYTLRVQKDPLRLGMYAADGTPILEDEPGLGVVRDGTEFTNYKKLQPGERFMGLGEKTGSLNRAEQSYVNYNTDQFGYHNGTDPLYASFPFYMGIAHGQPYGVFLDNTATTEFNFGASSQRYSYFKSERGGLDYYFFYGDTQNLKSILRQYTALTGRSPLPPKWALGFQQCRYSYFPDTEVLRIAETFREKDIPADVIYLDIHYMQDYKVFTWHEERFNQPEKTLRALRENGFEVVTIVDPGVKIEEDYPVYDSGKEEDVFVKYLDGKTYEGGVWPGLCHFPDFTNPATRIWWGGLFDVLTQAGVKGFWNDMNEPAVWGNSFPDATTFDYDGVGATHKEARNVYGLQMARATYEGARRQMPNERPFVLTRSAFSGIQNYAALWTGDNVANEEHLFLGTRLINSLGLSGVWMAGNDIGGFIDDVAPDVFVRWMQVGAFSPFCRCHSMVNSRSSEPWTFGESATEIARNFIVLRYKLMPMLYSLAYEAHKEGMPLQRPMAFHYPHDPKVYDGAFENQFLIGESWLVVPCPAGQNYVKLYLPEGRWYDVYSDTLYEGGQELVYETPLYKLPIFVKAGAVIPMTETGINVYDKADAPLELHAYCDAAANSSFRLYDDDGRTYDCEQGEYYCRTLEWNGEKQQLVVQAREGTYAYPRQKLRVYWHGTEPIGVSCNDQELAIAKTDFRLLKPLTSFDPWEQEPDQSMVIKGLCYTEVDLEEGEMVLRLEK